MTRNNSERRTSFCLILLSAAIGLLVHPFYDWTGADQSRPVALLWQVPLAISVALGLFCVALPWIPIQRGVEPIRLLKKGTGSEPTQKSSGLSETSRGACPLFRQADTRQPLQFSLRFLLLATGAIAVLLGTGIRYPNVFTSIVGLSAVLLAVHCWRRFPDERWSISALLAAMYLPYGWFLFNSEIGMIHRILLFATHAANLPTYLVVLDPYHVLGPYTPVFIWIAIGMVLTSLELAVGLFLIHLGPKRGFAFVVCALILSMFGAVILDSLVRM